MKNDGLGWDKIQEAPKNISEPNDATRYIFPAGQAAPGASFSPSPGEELDPVALQATIEAPIQAASAESAVDPASKYNIPADRNPANSAPGSAADPNYFQQAYNLETDASRRMGDFEKSAYDKIAAQDQKSLKDFEDLRSREQDLTKKFDETYKQLSEDVNSKKLDSRRWWKEKSTGDKVLTMIGLALSALSPTSFQSAMSAIDKTIERDINDQKSDIMNGRQKLQDAKTLYAENLRRFGDERAALAATRMMNADVIKNQLQSQLSGVKGDLAKANGLKFLGQIEQYKQKQAVEVAKLLKDQAKDARGLTVIGYEGQFPTVEEAKTFRDLKTTTDSSNKMIDRLIEINKTPFKSLSPDLRLEAENIQKVLIGNLRVALTGPGAMNESEQELLNDVIANPTSVFSRDSGNDVRLKSLKNALQTKITSAAKTYGVRPASSSITSFRPN